jgi:hypothetical protein
MKYKPAREEVYADLQLTYFIIFYNKNFIIKIDQLKIMRSLYCTNSNFIPLDFQHCEEIAL